MNTRVDRSRSRLFAALGALVLSVSLAACTAPTGDGGGTAAPSASEGPAESPTGYQLVTTAADTAAAEKAGAEAASAAAEKPEGKKVAFIHFMGQSTSSQRIFQGIQDAAAAMGYEVISCDPNADPQKVKECATAMVVQKPDLILSYYQEAIGLGSAIDDARAAGIPWVSVQAPVTPHASLIQYTTPTEDMQEEINQAVIDGVTAAFPGEEAKVLGFAAAPTSTNGALQRDSFTAAMEGAAGIDLVAVHDLDLSDVQQDTIKTTRQYLTQNPDLRAIWTVCDTCVSTVRQAAQTQGGEMPLIYGSFSAPSSIADIRAGAVQGVVDLPLESYGWITLDRALDHWVSGQPMSEEDIIGAYSLPFAEPYVIDKGNAGTGPLPILGPDYEAFFTAKWNAQFGSR